MIFANLLKGISKGLPAQVAYFFNSTIHTKIQEIIARVKPDHIYCQLIRTSEYARQYSISKTLDYMDCFSLSTLKRSQLSSPFFKMLWEIEVRRTRNYEASVYRDFDHHTIISDLDAKAMPIKKDSKTLHIIQNGLAADYLDVLTNGVRDIDILFLGNLGYFSNQSAIEYIIDHLMPIIRTKHQNLKIVIAGADPDHQIIQKIKKAKLELIADIPHPMAVYVRAKIFIAPIFQGTGQQNKVLEALACGCAVICSPEVQLGLSLPSPEIVHIAHTPIEYVSLIFEQLDSKARNSKDSIHHIKSYLGLHFSWQESVTKLLHLIRS